MAAAYQRLSREPVPRATTALNVVRRSAARSKRPCSPSCSSGGSSPRCPPHGSQEQVTSLLARPSSRRSGTPSPDRLRVRRFLLPPNEPPESEGDGGAEQEPPGEEVPPRPARERVVS